MKKIILFSILVLTTTLSYAQASMNNSGDWDDGTKWGSGNIGDDVNETVTIGNNVNPTVRNGFTYTVGNTTLNQNNTLSVTGTLNIGDATHTRTLTTNNNANVTVSGTLIIWGNVQVNNNIVWTISGTVIIKGSLIMSNNANLTVSGNLSIGGNFSSGNNTNATVSGSVTVGGNVSVGGGGSNLTSCAGCFQHGGTCSPAGSSFCTNSVLPIKLLSFTAASGSEGIEVNWVTSLEKNFDFFQLEKAGEDISFTDLAKIAGKGGLDITTSYGYVDESPKKGKNFYRLKSVDLDGSFEYSNVILATWTGDSKGVALYPTIVDHSFTVDLNDTFNGPVKLAVLGTVEGNSMFQMDLTSQSTTVELPSTVKPGVYLVKLFSPSAQRIVRIVVK